MRNNTEDIVSFNEHILRKVCGKKENLWLIKSVHKCLILAYHRSHRRKKDDAIDEKIIKLEYFLNIIDRLKNDHIKLQKNLGIMRVTTTLIRSYCDKQKMREKILAVEEQIKKLDRVIFELDDICELTLRQYEDLAMSPITIKWIA